MLNERFVGHDPIREMYMEMFKENRAQKTSLEKSGGQPNDKNFKNTRPQEAENVDLFREENDFKDDVIDVESLWQLQPDLKN